MLRLLLSLLASATAALSSLAQSPARTAAVGAELRANAVGEIRTKSGEPWAGAEVVLLSRPLPDDPNTGEVDEVIATTDAMGRFTAAILRGRPYTAWAWGKPTADGRPASAVTERVFPQRPVVAQELRVLPVRRVVLDGQDRWSGCSGFTMRVVDQTANVRVTWVEVTDGAATLPFLVGACAFVEVLARQGEIRIPVARVRIAADDPAGEVRIDLPERQRVNCWIRRSQRGGQDGDRACPGAAVFRRLGGALYPAGTTDAAGKLALDIAKVAPLSSEFGTLVFAEGRMAGICTQARERQQLAFGASEQDLPEGAVPGDLFANVDAGESLHARIVGLEGKPVAGLTVWCSGQAWNRPSRSSGQPDHWVRTFITDDRGRFTMSSVGKNKQRMAHLVLRERDYEALPPRWRAGLLPIVFAPLVGQPGEGTVDDPIVVDLRSMCPIELRFLEEGGTPAADVGFVACSLAPEAYAHWPEVGNDTNADAIADQLGRLRVLVPGGQHLGFRATRGMSMLIRGFETTRGRPDDGPAVAQFQMPPPTGIRGRLLEPGGGAGRNRTVFATFGTNNQPAAWSYASQDVGVLADQQHNRFRVLLPDELGERLSLAGLIGKNVATDDEGRFALPLPFEPIPDLMLFTGRIGERMFADSINIDWRGEPRDDLEWRARL